MINAILCIVAILALLWLGRRLERLHEEEKRDIKKLHESRVTNLKENYERLLEATRYDCDTWRRSAEYGLEQERAIHLKCLNWQERAKFLWNLLDDIDTLDDECRNNHMRFRARVRATQQRRKEAAESDGYVLTWKNDPKETT